MTTKKARRTLSFLLFCAIVLVGCGGTKHGSTTTTTQFAATTTTTTTASTTLGPTTTAVPTGPVTPNYGESPTAVPYVATTTTTVPPESDKITATATAFLTPYWAAGQRTYGQLADDLSGVATPDLLAPWRDPNYAGLSAQPDAPVTFVSVTITAATETTATVAGKGSNTGTGGTVWRTLNLVRGDDAAWRVALLQ